MADNNLANTNLLLCSMAQGLAAVNRMRLTPRLPDPRALRALTRNALAETGLVRTSLARARSPGD